MRWKKKLVWKLKSKSPEDRIKEFEGENIDDDDDESEEEMIKETLKKPSMSFKSSKTKDRIVIVKELPMQPVRQVTEKDGVVIHFYTIEEYLTMKENGEI